MHSKGIIHRDLKPDNVLLDPEYHTKITDFGTGKIIGKDERARSDSFCGTEAYVSPELLDENDPFASKSSDLWALGIIVYQLLTGKVPFKGETAYKTFESIKKGEFQFPVDYEISSNAKDFIKQLLTLKPEDRLGAISYESLKKHPFFNGIDFTKLHELESPLKLLLHGNEKGNNNNNNSNNNSNGDVNSDDKRSNADDNSKNIKEEENSKHINGDDNSKNNEEDNSKNTNEDDNSKNNQKIEEKSNSNDSSHENNSVEKSSNCEDNSNNSSNENNNLVTESSPPSEN